MPFVLIELSMVFNYFVGISRKRKIKLNFKFEYLPRILAYIFYIVNGDGSLWMFVRFAFLIFKILIEKWKDWGLDSILFIFQYFKLI